MPDSVNRPTGGAAVDPSQRLLRVLLLGWWALIFTITHIPIPPPVGEATVPDKSIHFGMYAVLGALLVLWEGWRVRVSWRRCGASLAILAAYAVVDELLQIPVGRSAEWLDGAADLLGGVVGIGSVALVQWLWVGVKTGWTAPAEAPLSPARD
jgi:VanZ family protein